MFGLLQSLFKRPRSSLPLGSSPGATKAAGAPTSTFPDAVISSGAPLFNAAPVPVYPDKGPAIPAVPPDALLDSQKEIVQQIRKSVGLPPEKFDRLVLPVLRRFAAYAHLLPASASHHHCGQGGLLRHSLEVAFYSCRHTESVVYAMEREPAVRRHIQFRYRLATLFAGLFHDMGKVVMDVGAISPDGKQVWSANAGSLYDWLVANELPGYYVTWRVTDRHRRHEGVGLGHMRELLGKETLDFLHEYGGAEVFDRLNMAVLNQPDADNPITPVVLRYDSLSVGDDEKATRERHLARAAGEAGKLPLRILQVLQRLVREKLWTVNEPGAQVWVTDCGVFLNHPDVLRTTLESMHRQGEQGIPADPATVLLAMGQAGLFMQNGSRNVASAFLWPVSVCVPTTGGQSMWVNLTAARLEQPELLFEQAALPKLLPARPDGKPTAEVDTQQSSLSLAPAATDVQPSAASEAPENALRASPTDDKEVHVTDRRGANDGNRHQYVEGRRESDTRVSTLPDAMLALAEHDREGTFLADAIRLMQSGVLVGERDWAVKDGHVVLAHEPAFKHLGLEFPQLLKMFRDKRWIEALPATPEKYVENLQGSDGIERKAIRFSARMSSVILLACQPSPSPSAREPSPATSPVATNADRVATSSVPPERRDLFGDVDPNPQRTGKAHEALDHDYMKVLLYKRLESLSFDRNTKLSEMPEVNILSELAVLAKQLELNPDVLMGAVTSTRTCALLTKRSQRLMFNSRFQAERFRVPVGFYERYPNAPKTN